MGAMRIPSPLRIAILIFLLSLVLRIAWAAFAHITPIIDSREYDTLAVRWLSTGNFGTEGRLAYRSPGYPGFLAAVYAVFGHSWKAVAIIQAFLGAMTSGLLVLLAAHVLSPRGSAIAGLLHALSPPAIVYVPIIASENLALPLLIVGLLCLAIADAQSAPRVYAAMAGSGAALGLLLLVRPAAVFFLPACLLLAAYSPRNRVWRLRPPLILLCMTLLLLAPWLVRNYVVGLGPLTLSTTGGMNAWMGNNDATTRGRFCGPALAALSLGDLSERERDAVYGAAALAWIRDHPRRYLALCRTRAIRLLGAVPDPWARRYLAPTRENNSAILAASRRGKGGTEASPPTPSPNLAARWRAARERNTVFLGFLRSLVAPLTLLALILSFRRWRTYAIVVLPALCYLGALSLVYAVTRFRQLSDPLLFVPLAGLLSDLLFGSTELGTRPSRGLKLGAAVLVVIASVVLHATGLAMIWYRLAPIR